VGVGVKLPPRMLLLSQLTVDGLFKLINMYF